MRAAARAAIALAIAAPLHAQSPIEPVPPFDHWTRSALYRLAGLGVIEAGEALASWPLPGARVGALLDQAAHRSDLPPSVRTYRQRLDAEVDSLPGPALWLRAGIGFAGQDRQLLAGTSRPVDSGPAYPGPRPAPDHRSLALRAAASARLLDRLLVAVDARNPVPGRHVDDEPAIAAAYVAAHAGPFDVRAGRIPLSFGSSRAGGFVLHTPTPFDGVAVDVAGFRLPWIFRYAGTVRIAQLIARMDRSGDIDHPWMAATRITFAPAAPLVIGAQRAVLLGGDGNEPVTFRRVVLALLGRTDEPGKDSDFENQVVAFDAFWKLPGVPASLHAEWSFDDAGAAFHKVPAIAIGGDWHALPFAREVGAGLEFVVMTPAVAAHPPWYQHTALGDGWTDRGLPLGHPLGGHGREVALTLTTSGAVEATGRFFWRDRGDLNLFAPDRAGSAFGLRAEGVAFLHPAARLRFRSEMEHHASGWAWTADLAVDLLTRF